MFWQAISADLLAPRYLYWLWEGFLVTLEISFLTVILSTLLGLLLAMGRSSHSSFIRCSVIGYNAIFRYSPLLPQLFFWYFGVGSLLPLSVKTWLFSEPSFHFIITITLPSFEFLIGLIGLICYSSAFIAEEFRAGILGVKKEQLNAGSALGYNILASDAIYYYAAGDAYCLFANNWPIHEYH